MKEIIKWFEMGMSLKALKIYHSSEIKPITVPGMRYKLIKILGETEYKRIRQKHIKFKDKQAKYKLNK